MGVFITLLGHTVANTLYLRIVFPVRACGCLFLIPKLYPDRWCAMVTQSRGHAPRLAGVGGGDWTD